MALTEHEKHRTNKELRPKWPELFIYAFMNDLNYSLFSVLVVGPEVLLGDTTALVRSAGTICRSFKVVTEIIACVVRTLTGVLGVLQIFENTGVAVFQLILKIMELTVEAVPVISIAVTIVFQFIQTGTAPLT